MRILVACERFGRVRNAFNALGHDAWSCDLEPDVDGSPFHYRQDVVDLLPYEWDMIIAFPPCTRLCSSGAWTWAKHHQQQIDAIEFFMRFANHPCPKIAIENPIGIMSSVWRKPDQIIQPWMFGHGETKATCLWLKGLPKLVPTNVVEGRRPRVAMMAPGPNRAAERGKTYQGIADAMAQQWGTILE
jgi:hypothetical protein